MSRTVRNERFDFNSNACGAGPRHWRDDPKRCQRDGRDVGTTRLRAQRREKDFLQKEERLKEKEDLKKELEMYNEELD